MSDSEGEQSVGFRGWNVGSLSSETSAEEDDELQEPVSKKRKMMEIPTQSTNNAPVYADFASKMLAKMGYEEGKGLGKNKQGRTEIIEASKQRGRRGLGLEVKGFEQDFSAGWNFNIENVTPEETVEWMSQNYDPIPDLDTMKSWLKTGPVLEDVPLTSDFCDDEIVQKVVDCKSVFDNLENEEMRRARTKSNPFETIRGGIFQNRAAMKMANMDAVCDFMFTNPKDEDGYPLIQPDELLYFADVCAGPGGFSEYILWRRKCTAKGFGFTLKGPNDFKLHEFYSAPSELFEPHYGVHDDGDIYRPDNLIAFREFVYRSTENKGVHFVMADGGFSVEGMENLQEIRSNRLYLCQFLCALSILRPGGHFVCKLFDIFTNYSVGLVYLMFLAFERISIFKPVTSRPANSERYIICKSKHENVQDIHDYMFYINEKFEEISNVLSKRDISEIVPLDVLKSNIPFTNYITHSSEELGVIQSMNLEKIRVFAQNPTLHDGKQAELREECLRLWNVPDQVRAAPKREDDTINFQKLIKNVDIDFANPRPLTPDTLRSFHSRYDYKFAVLGGEQRYLIMSSGRSQVTMWSGSGKWQKLSYKNNDVKVELPRDTILEVEFLEERQGEGKGQKKITAIHVLDALVIYGENIQHLSYELRILRAKLFCKAVHRATRSDLATIRVKEQFDLCDLHEYYDRLQDKVLKGLGPQPRTCYRMDKDRVFVPRGLMIIKIVKDPWMLAHSRSSGKIYYFNTNTKQALYEFPDDARLSYDAHLRQRIVWYRKDPLFQNDSPMIKQCISEDAITQHLSTLPP